MGRRRRSSSRAATTGRSPAGEGRTAAQTGGGPDRRRQRDQKLHRYLARVWQAQDDLACGVPDQQHLHAGALYTYLVLGALAAGAAIEPLRRRIARDEPRGPEGPRAAVAFGAAFGAAFGVAFALARAMRKK